MCRWRTFACKNTGPCAEALWKLTFQHSVAPAVKHCFKYSQGQVQQTDSHLETWGVSRHLCHPRLTVGLWWLATLALLSASAVLHTVPQSFLIARRAYYCILGRLHRASGDFSFVVGQICLKNVTNCRCFQPLGGGMVGCLGNVLYDFSEKKTKTTCFG